MLSTQIAISFSNAKLYNDLQDANRLLAQKNKALIEFDQIKDQFLANTSHELRYFNIFPLIFILFCFLFVLFLLSFINF